MFGALLLAIVLGLIYEEKRTQELFLLVPSSFFALGKFLPLASLSGLSNFSAYELGLVIWVMDTCTVLLIVYSLEAIIRIKIIGLALDRIWANAALVLHAYPRLRKLTVPGIVLFVLFPIAGTGSIGGTFLGALLRMHRVTLILSVSLGGFFGGMSMAYATLHFHDAVERLEDNRGNPALLAGMVGLAIALLFWAHRAYRSALMRAQEENLTKSRIYEEARRKKRKPKNDLQSDVTRS